MEVFVDTTAGSEQPTPEQPTPEQPTPVFSFQHWNIPIRFWLPDAADHIQRIIRTTCDFYEAEMLGDIALRATPGALAVDVGANIGNHTVFFSRVCGMRVVALEPVPHCIDILKENIRLNSIDDMVVVIPKAAGRELCRGRVVVPDSTNFGMSFVHKDEAGEVEILRLDEVPLDDRVNILKVDVEGSVMDVLAGARSLLKRDRPLLYVETADPGSFYNVREFLAPLGYHVVQRFNWTPTFLFAPFKTAAEHRSLILSSFSALSNVQRRQDVRIQQVERQVQRVLDATLSVNHKLSEKADVLRGVKDDQLRLLAISEGLRDGQVSLCASHREQADRTLTAIAKFEDNIGSAVGGQAGLLTELREGQRRLVEDDQRIVEDDQRIAEEQRQLAVELYRAMEAQLSSGREFLANFVAEQIEGSSAALAGTLSALASGVQDHASAVGSSLTRLTSKIEGLETGVDELKPVSERWAEGLQRIEGLETGVDGLKRVSERWAEGLQKLHKTIEAIQPSLEKDLLTKLDRLLSESERRVKATLGKAQKDLGQQLKQIDNLVLENVSISQHNQMVLSGVSAVSEILHQSLRDLGLLLGEEVLARARPVLLDVKKDLQRRLDRSAVGRSVKKRIKFLAKRVAIGLRPGGAARS